MKRPFVRAGVALLAAGMAVLLGGCTPQPPDLNWVPVTLSDAGLQARFPCQPDVAQRKIDFGMEGGPSTVNMMGCDAVDSTYAVSHWLLDDARQAEDALVFWEAAVLSKHDAVDGEGASAKSGAPFTPPGAMPLARSIRATVQGLGPSGWNITTHAVWFARQEGDKARIFHAVIYSPKPQHEVATQFFNGLTLLEPPK